MGLAIMHALLVAKCCTNKLVTTKVQFAIILCKYSYMTFSTQANKLPGNYKLYTK